jgi:hypothetical protein
LIVDSIWESTENGAVSYEKHRKPNIRKAPADYSQIMIACSRYPFSTRESEGC